MSSLCSCVCVWDPPWWKVAPSLKCFLWVHSDLGHTHTHAHARALHMKQTDERSRYPRPSGSHGICGMLLYFPLNSLVFVFFLWSELKCMHACVCVFGSSAPHTPWFGLSSAHSRFCLIGQQTETGRLERQYPASAECMPVFSEGKLQGKTPHKHFKAHPEKNAIAQMLLFHNSGDLTEI